MFYHDFAQSVNYSLVSIAARFRQARVDMGERYRKILDGLAHTPNTLESAGDDIVWVRILGKLNYYQRLSQ